MRSWQEKCGRKKTLRALCYSRSGDYLPGRSLFSRRGPLPSWRRYDKCSGTHLGRNESLSLKLLECCHDCTPGKAILCCKISRGRQSCSRFQSAIDNCGTQLSIEPAPHLLAILPWFQNQVLECLYLRHCFRHLSWTSHLDDYGPSGYPHSSIG